MSAKAFLFFTESNMTSDFIVDGIELWWNTRKEDLAAVQRLVINMDNGVQNAVVGGLNSWSEW